MLINFDSLTILRMFEVEVMKNLVIVESPSKSKTIIVPPSLITFFSMSQIL